MTRFGSYIKKVKVPGSSGKGRKLGKMPGHSRTYRSPKAR